MLNVPDIVLWDWGAQFDRIEVVNRLRKDLVYETVKNYTIHYDQTWIFEKM